MPQTHKVLQFHIPHFTYTKLSSLLISGIIYHKDRAEFWGWYNISQIPHTTSELPFYGSKVTWPDVNIPFTTQEQHPRGTSDFYNCNSWHSSEHNLHCSNFKIVSHHPSVHVIPFHPSGGIRLLRLNLYSIDGPSHCASPVSHCNPRSLFLCSFASSLPMYYTWGCYWHLQLNKYSETPHHLHWSPFKVIKLPVLIKSMPKYPRNFILVVEPDMWWQISIFLTPRATCASPLSKSKSYLSWCALHSDPGYLNFRVDHDIWIQFPCLRLIIKITVLPP